MFGETGDQLAGRENREKHTLTAEVVDIGKRMPAPRNSYSRLDEEEHWMDSSQGDNWRQLTRRGRSGRVGGDSGRFEVK